MPVAERSVRGQAIADLTAEASFDDDEVDDWEPKQLPDRADMRPYKTPRQYWEPEYPGQSLMPYPRLGHFTCSEDGRWMTHTKWEEDAVRNRLARFGDPDDFKVTDEHLAIVRGKTPGTSHYCHTAFCRLVTCSPLAARLHAELRGHDVKLLPRKAN